MQRVLVIGGDGVIGGALRQALAHREIGCAWTSRRSEDPAALRLDLEESPERWPVLPEADAAFVCAGMTKLADCEADPGRARRVNVDQTARLTQGLAERCGVVVNLSTSQVFDGSAPRLDDSAAPCPASRYGRVKADAEQAVQSACPQGLVVRLVKVFGPAPNLWSRWRGELEAGRSIDAYDDLRIAPMRRRQVAELLLDAAAMRLNRTIGPVAHLTADRDESYFHLARQLCVAMNIDPGQVRRASAEADGIPAAHRPAHTALGGSTMDALGVARPDPFMAVLEAAGLDG
ncbi:MAG: sugar nucleotide-binding protein [Planctomycetota bacterium]